MCVSNVFVPISSAVVIVQLTWSVPHSFSDSKNRITHLICDIAIIICNAHCDDNEFFCKRSGDAFMIRFWLNHIFIIIKSVEFNLLFIYSLKHSEKPNPVISIIFARHFLNYIHYEYNLLLISLYKITVLINFIVKCRSLSFESPLAQFAAIAPALAQSRTA